MSCSAIQNDIAGRILVFESIDEPHQPMNVINDTPFPEFLFYWVKPDQTLALTAVVRAEFSIPDKNEIELQPCLSQTGPQFVDSWYGDPRNSSLRSEHDRIPYKQRGETYFVDPISRPQSGKPADEWRANVNIGEDLQFGFKVFGPRVFDEGVFSRPLSQPEDATSVAVRYENMFGGQCTDDPTDRHPENPVGCGFRFKSGLYAGGKRGPQVEQLSGGFQQEPPGLTPLSRAWTPRREHAGVLDDQWLANRWPLFPDSFSADFYQQSPRHLQLPNGFFRGDEIVEFNGIGQRAKYRFHLPESRGLFIGIVDEVEPAVSRFELDTIVFDLEASKLSMIWRTVVHSATNDSQFYIAFEEFEDA